MVGEGEGQDDGGGFHGGVPFVFVWYLTPENPGNCTAPNCVSAPPALPHVPQALQVYNVGTTIFEGSRQAMIDHAPCKVRPI